MILRLRIVFILASLTCALHAQPVWCDVDAKLEAARMKDMYDEVMARIIQKTKALPIQNRSEKWFQVVVHVVSRQGYQPVTEAQIIHQIDVLNNDFAGKGENITNLPDEFTNLVADTGLKFCLAKTDPNGNPTSGITYTTTSIPDIGIKTGDEGRGLVYYDKTGGKTGWDPTRYINIWISEFGGSILGSASFPGMAQFPQEIGLVIDIRYFGAIGDASRISFFGRGHTLTHEMGHFLGLLHIWGQGGAFCTDTDEVEDTPNAAGPYFGCPSGVQTTCNTSNMYQNFMDLTDDRCLAAFTNGQSMRMQGAIEAFYSDLVMDGPCNTIIEPFDKWWDDLVWAYDAYSRQYIFYTAKGYSGKINVDVFSVDGRMIMQDTLQGQQSFLLDLNDVATGIYFVRIIDGEHRRVRKISVY